MDVLDFSSFSFSGQGLNVEERAGLEVAINKRRLDDGLREVQFWGKLFGEGDDYLVVVGFGASTDFPNKRFFYATTKSYALVPFPELTEAFAKTASTLSGRLKGDPALRLGPDADEEDEDEVDDDGVPKPKKVRFTESHRLAYLVANIDREVSVVPRGAYVVTPTHYIIRNAAYEGLTATEAGELSNYLHFRQPENLGRKSVLERRGLVASTDFLDPISEDSPAGVWAARVDKQRGQATLRSLVWPGYFFFHNVDTARFGGAYFGDGRRNDDIGFMV